MRDTAERMHLKPGLSSANPGPDENGLARHWVPQHARIIPNESHFLGWPQDEASETAPA